MKLLRWASCSRHLHTLHYRIPRYCRTSDWLLETLRREQLPDERHVDHIHRCRDHRGDDLDAAEYEDSLDVTDRIGESTHGIVIREALRVVICRE